MTTFKHLIIFTLLAAISLPLAAQQPVPVGKGSYAEYPPLYKSRTDDRGGDQSQKMLHRKIFVTDRMKGQAIPTNDWWTDLLMTEFSGNLWAYPIMINAEEYGIFVEYPTRWTDDGCEMKSDSQLKLSAKKFRPAQADVDGWHDWGFNFIMQDAEKQMRVSLAHGMPFTWVETQNLVLQIPYRDEKLYTTTGQVSLPQTTSALAIKLGNDVYGLYAPEGTTFTAANGMMDISFAGEKQYLVIGVLPDENSLGAFAPYAYAVPRDTKVEWNYDETAGKLQTTWTVTAQNLNNGQPAPVMQGFIPHHYKNSQMDFTFTGDEYDTPRGKMKMATGNSFTISYNFAGIVPYWAVPEENPALQNPYQRQRMKLLIEDYANKGSFGGDTYWGGKGLIQMALYMTFAHQMNEPELFEKCKHRLREVLINWFTYTPGEERFFFSAYGKWGAMMGYDTSYDSDTFNDHHFHYGYFTYAASLLALFDDDFKRDYGEMVTLVVKDYANWEREDQGFPFFRTFDPWAGHSYAGGLAGWGGNGQESSSEAMQGWGGLYTLGLALNNKEMRDAGIFGWLLESRGIAEYWFDRDRENIRHDLFVPPYNSNLTSQGIGWWTWFSGDPVWMHSIQWLPISPMQSHLYEDLEFAEWEYTQMWEKKEIGGWLNTSPPEKESALSQESGLGNVVLSYLQIFNPDSAAAVFDRMWQYNRPVAKNPDTGGISYYATHSHRTYGEIQWDTHANLPSANCYYNKATGKYTYVVYNHGENEQLCTFYKDGNAIKSFKAPARKYTVYREEPVVTDILLNIPAQVIEPLASMTITATPVDQYGATIDNTTTTWTSSGGSITANGLLTAPAAKGNITLSAAVGSVRKEFTLLVGDKSQLTSATILPDVMYLETGNEFSFTIDMKDQYGFDYETTVNWEIVKDGTVVKRDPFFDLAAVGEYTVKATIDTKEYSKTFKLLPSFPNIALGKKATASSEENAGSKAESATDGDNASRWGSEHHDGEWIYVNLGEKCYIGYVTILWEAAYASLYELQLSDDGKNWTTAQRVNGTGGLETTPINAHAQYVRMLGLERGSDYGFSLYELEVHGVPATLNPQAIFGLQVFPESILLKEGEPVQLSAKAYNGLAQEVEVPITWSVDKECDINVTGILVPSLAGKITVTASAQNVTAKKVYQVEETLKAKSIVLQPRAASLIVGKSQTFETVTKDQFGNDFPAGEINYRVIGEGASFEDGVFTANKVGQYLLIAEKGLIADTATVTVDKLANINLALHKQAFASSSENNELVPTCATDGDMKTRWGSLFNDNEYLMVDLEGEYIINRVKLFWQDSHAASYRIDVSVDDENWESIYSNPSARGGEEELTFEAVAARYVRIFCLSRNSAYGSSLWEVEIYGTHEWTNPRPADIIFDEVLTFYIGESTRVNATIKDQYGLVFDPTQAVYYTTNGGGEFSDGNLFTPHTAGEYTLTVTCGQLSRDFPFTVSDVKRLESLAITPAYVKLKANETLQFTAKGIDQYGNDYPVSVAWSNNQGLITPEGVFASANTGIFTVTATYNSKTATATVEVINIGNTNLALRKPADASTNPNTADAAVDGNGGSRWESAHQEGPEWLMVNLEGAYLITDVEIDWETASAADYEVQLSADGNNWNSIAQVTGRSEARTDQLRVNGSGQYIRVYCTRRSTSWGYSIHELRVYGQAMQKDEPYTLAFINPVEEIEFGASAQYRVEVRDYTDKVLTDLPVIWSVNDGGIVSADGLFSSRKAGNFVLTATCGTISATLALTVNAPITNIATAEEEEIVIELNGRQLYVNAPQLKQITITDLAGRVVLTDMVHNDTWQKQLDEPQGFYLLIVKTEEGRRVWKFKM